MVGLLRPAALLRIAEVPVLPGDAGGSAAGLAEITDVPPVIAALIETAPPAREAQVSVQRSHGPVWLPRAGIRASLHLASIQPEHGRPEYGR
ncbi:MAG: hypothetical protein HWD60_06565 [Defluviicoccus sp.]|nr:MAG: hypothetical protein HWD60_06565 [Defluviicoccus sp.]